MIASLPDVASMLGMMPVGLISVALSPCPALTWCPCPAWLSPAQLAPPNTRCSCVQMLQTVLLWQGCAGAGDAWQLLPSLSTGWLGHSPATEGHARAPHTAV